MTEHCENGYTTERCLLTQCNPHQNSNDILHRNIETQKIPHNKSYVHHKAQWGTYHSTGLQIVLESHGNSDSGYDHKKGQEDK
jgi:hypothetical protein